MTATHPSTDYGMAEVGDLVTQPAGHNTLALPQPHRNVLDAERYGLWPPIDNAHMDVLLTAYRSSEWVSGRPADDLEEAITTYFTQKIEGYFAAIATTSGTDALTLAVQAALDPQNGFFALGKSQKMVSQETGWPIGVITPAFSFSGSVLPILRAGYVPVFADVDPISGVVTERTLNRAYETAKHAGIDVRAVIRVQQHGHPCSARLTDADWEAHISYIDDMCQAHATKPNQDADFLCFSFNINKMVPAGEGGALLVRGHHAAKLVKELRQFGEPDAWLDLPTRTYMTENARGGNFRINGFSAAVAAESWRQLPNWAEDAKVNATAMMDTLSADGRDCAIETLRPAVTVFADHSWQKVRLRVTGPNEGTRDHVLASATFARAKAAGLPVCTWQVEPLPYHAAFRPFVLPGQSFDGASDLLRSSFVLYTDSHPIWAQERTTVVEDVTQLATIFDQVRA